MRAQRRGVSLPIVMATLCLVAVAAVVVIPAFFGRPSITLDNACRLLAHDLRSVQNRCSVQKTPARMAFDADGWCALDTSDQPISGLGEQHPLSRRFSRDGVFEGVRVTNIDLGPDASIAIDRRGLVTLAGELQLAFGGETRRVEIARGSGQVLVYTPGEDRPAEAQLVK